MMDNVTRQAIEWFEYLRKNMSGTEYGVYIDMAIEALSETSRQGQRDGLIKRQDAIDALKHDANVLGIEPFDKGYTPFDAIQTLHDLSSAQPDNRLAKIADLVEGTIDHFGLDDAMDLIYQIKEIIKNG